jgi:cytochrome c oxidase subunit II
VVFKKIVNIVEVLALVAALAFVIALFTGGSDSASTSSGPRSGAEIYGASCAVCHGDDGQGGVGPRLSDGAAVEAFPDAADEVEVVTNGRAAMPSFKGQLSEAEIQAVVEYTRTGLG